MIEVLQSFLYLALGAWGWAYVRDDIGTPMYFMGWALFLALTVLLQTLA